MDRDIVGGDRVVRNRLMKEGRGEEGTIDGGGRQVSQLSFDLIN